MRSRSLERWLIILAATAWVVPTFAGDDQAYDSIEDIEYARVGDSPILLDLARPSEGDGPFPAVVVIHGGAWRGGSKSHHVNLLGDLARRGYVAIAPNYRLCPADRFPAQVHDVKAAVRWLRGHAAEYHVDPNRIAAVGFSAGGHLALMLGMTDPSSGLEGDVPAGSPSSRVSAVVNYFGPTDFLAPGIPLASKFLLRDFLGKLPDQAPELARRASPVTYATSDDPPTLTFHGTKDPIVPFDQASRLAIALSQHGVPGRVELVLGAGHGWFGLEQRRTTAATFAFLDEQLRPASKAPGASGAGPTGPSSTKPDAQSSLSAASSRR